MLEQKKRNSAEEIFLKLSGFLDIVIEWYTTGVYDINDSNRIRLLIKKSKVIIVSLYFMKI